MRMNGTSLGSVMTQSTQYPADRWRHGREYKKTKCGWNNWRKMSGVLCDKVIPPRVVEGTVSQNDGSAICAVRDGDSADNQLPHKETESDGYEYVQVGMQAATL